MSPMYSRFTLVLAACALFGVTQPSSALSSSTSAADFRLSGVSLQETTYQGKPAFEIKMPSSDYQDPTKERLTDRTFMAWLPLDFHDGTIEVDIASDLAPDAPAYARGFAGISFRIDPTLRFENIYLRPTNAVADDQVRRNHTIQYFAYPDYVFDRVRKESPETYETYAEINLGRWIHMKVVVTAGRAQLYLDSKEQPALLVNDLKLGADQHGGVGIWIESGTIAHFRDLRVTHAR
ncbi:MAG: hypothetical protein P4M05_27180 [Bradyrhizobium sp.]|nr:hypothetical protein [Bradyrhizobium sp.]